MIIDNVVINNIKTLNVYIIGQSLARITQEGGEVFDVVIDRTLYTTDEIFLTAIDKELNPTPNGLKRL